MSESISTTLASGNDQIRRTFLSWSIFAAGK